MGIAARLDNLRAQRVAAGHLVSRLAALSNTSDLLINVLETIHANGKGGTCTHVEADRLCAALGISRATSGFTELG
jgi:hypothetical protein